MINKNGHILAIFFIIILILTINILKKVANDPR